MEGTQYIFGHDGNAMILKTVGATHTCDILRKYRSFEGADGTCYDVYLIGGYYRDTDRTVRTDKNVAALEAASDRLDAQATYTAMMTDTLMEG